MEWKNKVKHELIIKRIQVTEKGTDLKESGNKYLFRVDRNANKIEIKHAVEKKFDVVVMDVNTMNYTGKKKRERRANYGRRAHWKRAVVTLKEGSQIDLT